MPRRHIGGSILLRPPKLFQRVDRDAEFPKSSALSRGHFRQHGKRQMDKRVGKLKRRLPECVENTFLTVIAADRKYIL